jgi:hypothetical protein
MINHTGDLKVEWRKSIGKSDICRLTFGANRANSVHQLVSVESGAITRNGPGALS